MAGDGAPAVILLGRGDGSFLQPGEPGRFFVPVSGRARFVTIGDMDNDGRPDLVLGWGADKGVGILRNRSE